MSTPILPGTGEITLSDGVQTITIPYASSTIEWTGEPPPTPTAACESIPVDGSVSFTVRQFYAFAAPLPAEVREARRAHRRTVRRQRRARRGWR